MRSGRDAAVTGRALAATPEARASRLARPMTGTVTDDGSARLRSISTTALELFAERGYRATTMADIAARIGIRAPSLYKHVQSKQSILSDIILRTLGAINDMQDKVLAASRDVEERLQLFVEAHARYNMTHQSEAMVIARERYHLEDPCFSEAMALQMRYEQILHEVIINGVSRGVFQTDHPQLVCRSILDMGIGVGSGFAPDGMHTLAEAAEAYGELALRMLLAPSACIPK